ncbi:MAG TPA: ATP-binding protein [Gemmatimonadaceae bacterium]|nr:ATP-binding protein [Gemmatimonadaceae bacterium]
MTPATPVPHVVAWLPAVRWVTCGVLLGMSAVAWVFPHLDLSIRAIAPLGLTAAVCRTLVAGVAHRRGVIPRPLMGVSLAADAALVTGLFDITGGPFNPFIVMYVVYIWVAWVTLSPAWCALVSIVSVAGFSWLVLDHLQVGQLAHHRLNDFPTHLFTMWLAGAAVAELAAHYIMRARVALAERQQSLDEARDRAVRSERLAALTTLAAGAAHELSTPLATIAVAARELERSASRLTEPGPVSDALRDDAHLIRMEVDRCRVILDGMSGRAGATTLSEALSPDAIARLALARLTPDQQRRLDVEIAPEAGVPSGDGAELAQALASLLKNAFDAGGPSDTVRLRVSQRGSMLRFDVLDRGPGMSEEVRRRAGEPFFTTKEPGRGLGLGLFLTRTIAERSGGSLRFEGESGTVAVLEIPVTAAEGRPA